MLLDEFEAQGLLYNSNFKESAGGGRQAYRGDLVLVEGEVADSLGRRKPPRVTMVGAALLADADKLVFAGGSLDTVADLEVLLEKYAPHCTPETVLMLHVVNIDQPMRVEAAGLSVILLPLNEGLAWSELVEELRLEKSDFKGQSSGEKVATLYSAARSYRSNHEVVSLETAKSRGTEAKRVVHGAV